MSEFSRARSVWTARVWRFSSVREAFGRRPGNHCTFQKVTVIWDEGESCAGRGRTRNVAMNNATTILGGMAAGTVAAALWAARERTWQAVSGRDRRGDLLRKTASPA